MSRIRAKNTKPELIVRSLIHRLGFRYRLHVRSLPGCPDVVLPKWKSVVFVHGCFWHRHRGCSLAYTPKSRTEFWVSKLEGNASRDRNSTKLLKKQGWKPLVVWECELRDADKLRRRLDRAIRN